MIAVADRQDNNDSPLARGGAQDTILAVRPVDAATEAYTDWREECVRVRDAHCGWTGTGPGGTSIALRRYVIALDREERAAARYAALVKRGHGRREISHAAAVRRSDHGMSSAHDPSGTELHKATVRLLFGVQIGAALITIVVWFAIRLLVDLS
ncbi:MAG: hypothetical protein ACLP8S_21245 [Solirubrobacteraceae bacterium]